MGKSTAGANGTSGGQAFVSDMRVRKMTCLVNTAGTTAGNNCILFGIGTVVSGYNLTPQVLTTNTGTFTLGSVVLTTNTVNAVVTSTDMNARVLAGTPLFLKNGTDISGVFTCNLETHLDPLATWT